MFEKLRLMNQSQLKMGLNRPDFLIKVLINHEGADQIYTSLCKDFNF